jgi:hypothetical protein
MRTDLRRFALLVAIGLTTGVGAGLAAQDRQGTAPRSAEETAPVDLTGYWVSYVNKEWRFRMVTPQKGDLFGAFGGIPLTPEARRAAEAWDPASDAAAGEACRAYGAAGLMRFPARFHVTWQDENTLRVDSDAGMQTRLFRFDEATQNPEPTWQGDSTARWRFPTVLRGRVAQPPSTPRGGEGAQPGSLEVVTSNLRPGYLRRNGVPYSGNTVMTEYWDVFKEPDGTDWLVITTTIEDAQYLQMPYQTSPAFKRERDGSKWQPTPCSAQ